MKFSKILTLFLASIMFSCSSSDDNPNSESSINPPQWIIGTWMQINPVESGLGVRFESDDLILISSTLETSYKDNIEIVKSSGQTATSENLITDTSYKLTIDYEVGASVVFEFTKLSDNQIIWANAFSNTILDKQ